MPHRSFTPRPAPEEPITFDVDGEKFTATGKATAALYMEMVNNANVVGFTAAQAKFIEEVLDPDDTPGDATERLVVEAIRSADPAATVEDRAAAIVSALRGAGLVREARSRWELALAQSLDPNDVTAIFDYLISVYADRPTGPPAG